MSYVLLIEDNQQNAEMMIKLLQSIGLEVKHEVQGLKGVRQARDERPDLILLDFNLPDIDGRNLILTMRKQLKGIEAPPIIAVTARTGTIEMTIARRFGCAAFISKPFVPSQFIAIVQQVLSQAKRAETPKS